MLDNHFHRFINIDYSGFFFLWLFAVVPDELPSHEQQPLQDSSWFVVDEPAQLPQALCRPLAHAGRAPQRNDIHCHDGDHGGDHGLIHGGRAVQRSVLRSRRVR